MAKKNWKAFEVADEYSRIISMRVMSCKGFGYLRIAKELRVLYPKLSAFLTDDLIEGVYRLVGAEEMGLLSAEELMNYALRLAFYTEDWAPGMHTTGDFQTTWKLVEGLMNMARGKSRRLAVNF